MINIPGFTIDKEVGHGGMATVYLGVQDLLKRDVALKVMLPEMVRDKNFRNSFMSEGAIIASLDHPNIVRIHDIGIVDDTILYMAMEYLSGNTLKEKLSKGKLSFSEAFQILKQVASGLRYAHDKGYIHRDIKPGNILFREDGTAVITDFGIAKLQDTSGELTRMGYTMGTVQYMSPEQVVTTDLDKRSDIYSLGLIFYEMLTGSKAFKAETTIQAIHQHTTLPPPTLEGEYVFLQTVIDKVLAKEPDDRYQDAEDFVKAVSEADPLDKTVIHRIHDDYKTQIFSPDQVREEKSNSNIEQKQDDKSKNKIIPLSLAGAALVGVVVFGVTQYMVIDTPLTTIDVKDVSNPVVEVVVKPDAIIKLEDTSTVTLQETPIEEVLAVITEPVQTNLDLKTKPKLNNKQINYFYEPKDYHTQVESELDEIVKISKEILVVAPDNIKARQILNDTLDRYNSLALDLIKSMDFDKAMSIVEKGLKISGDYEPLINLRTSLDRGNRKVSKVKLKTIQTLSKQAKIHIKEGRYVLPENNNALDSYQEVLMIDPHNQIASKEINSLLFIFEEQVKTNLRDNKYQANEFLNQALAISPLNKKLIQLQNKFR